mmetsp:Transcript_60002/g.127065  ORF Transcript_60002/g.127065 Transcript_60002/m.127065 type:complete len:368 (+) Transcript_60002:487-1590(+)
MDADRVVQNFLRQTALEGDAEPLHNLARVGAQDVCADDALVSGGVTHDLHVPLVLGGGTLARDAPVKGLRDGVVDLDVAGSQLLLGFVLPIAHDAVLQRSENRRGNVGIVHQLGGTAEQPLHQVASGLYSNRSELRNALDDVSDSEDVRNLGLVLLVHYDLAILQMLQAGCLQIQLRPETGAANSHEDGVVHPILLAVHEDFDLTGRGLFEFAWHHAPGELHVVLLHVVADLVGDILIEASKQNGPDHDGRVEAKARDEACALEGDVGGPDDQGLSRWLLLPKDVVGADAALLAAGVSAVAWPTTSCDEAILESDLVGLALHVIQVDSVVIGKGSEHVVILDVLRAQLCLGSPIQGLDVVVDLGDHV